MSSFPYDDYTMAYSNMLFKDPVDHYGRRPIDAMNTPAGFQGRGHYLLSDGIVEFYGWQFPPVEENGRPTNGFAFDDFTARINLNPNVLEAQRSLDN